MKRILIPILLLLSFSAAADESNCEGLRWKLGDTNGQLGIWRGRVTPGKVETIYLELYSKAKGLIGQGSAHPTPSGAWKIVLYADYQVRKEHIEKFYCE